MKSGITLEGVWQEWCTRGIDCCHPMNTRCEAALSTLLLSLLRLSSPSQQSPARPFCALIQARSLDKHPKRDQFHREP